MMKVVLLLCIVSVAFAYSEVDCVLGCNLDEYCCGNNECCSNTCSFSCNADEYCCGINICCKQVPVPPVCIFGCNVDEYCCGNDVCCASPTVPPVCIFGCEKDQHCCGINECCDNVCALCNLDEYCCGNNECCSNTCSFSCADDEYCCGDDLCCNLDAIWYGLWYSWVVLFVLVGISITGCCLCCRYCNRKPNVIIYQQPVTNPCEPATGYKQFQNEPI